MMVRVVIPGKADFAVNVGSSHETNMFILGQEISRLYDHPQHELFFLFYHQWYDGYGNHAQIPEVAK